MPVCRHMVFFSNAEARKASIYVASFVRCFSSVPRDATAGNLVWMPRNAIDSPSLRETAHRPSFEISKYYAK